MKRQAVFIVPSKDYRDEEYEIPKQMLEKVAVKIDTASSIRGTIQGTLGSEIESNLLIDEIDFAEYAAVVFIGGIGASEYYHNKKINKLIVNAHKEGRIIAAIDLATSTLAYTGILKNVRATSYPSANSILLEHGAELIRQGVVVDGNIITASSPQYSSAFGRQLVFHMNR